jgi:hypothetical protein
VSRPLPNGKAAEHALVSSNIVVQVFEYHFGTNWQKSLIEAQALMSLGDLWVAN